MNRVLVLGQILSLVLIGALAFAILGDEEGRGILGSSVVGSDSTPAVTGDGQALREQCSQLSDEIDRLIEENRTLSLRVEELELDSLSANTAIDDIQGMALQNSIRIRQRASEPARAAALPGAMESGGAPLGSVEYLVESYEDGTIGVAPEIDQAVRIVLANMDEERRQERQQRQVEREKQRFVRMGERFELSAGQVRVVEDAYEHRRQRFRDIRDQARAGHLDKETARQLGRAAQDRYHSEIVAVVGQDRFKKVQQFLDGDGDRKRPDAGRDRKAKPKEKKPGG